MNALSALAGHQPTYHLFHCFLIKDFHFMSLSGPWMWHSKYKEREWVCVCTWSLSKMCMPVGPCRYTWLIVPSGMLHTHAILRMSSAAVSSSRYRAWYTAQKHQTGFTVMIIITDGIWSLINISSICSSLPCKPEERQCSPFSLVLCLSSRGLSWRDSLQTYIVSLGRTDLHTQKTAWVVYHRAWSWHDGR